MTSITTIPHVKEVQPHKTWITPVIRPAVLLYIGKDLVVLDTSLGLCEECFVFIGEAAIFDEHSRIHCIIRVVVDVAS